ncbi:protein SanA, affects membrane permeability for vancomycin [Paenibacillus catalpae]|uniref:Protein SanA, affects membrane permeability for vancomycin n=1 Tax=Paenibacillus catalpae TaxID=1045775 RepID=A0A1I2FY19_9BACL|nr:ElyC/SanA/YdcF family protein [Paenibacillus catalpae]SFF09406.1 protein SanA, affects membrane permeability for vancomycin [Paenibacillus catalpae]
MKSIVQTRSKSRKRRGLLLFRICIGLCLVGLLYCGYLLWLINSYDDSAPIEKADAAIVLGASLWSDKPSPALKERLDFAYKLYKEGKVKQLILSGGLDHNGSKLTEAEGMRVYLLEKGIPADKMLLDNAARSTYENLLNSKVIAADHQLKKLLIVTHDYHAPRAMEIARYLDYQNAEAAAFHSEVLNPFKNQSREVLAFAKWKVDAVLLHFGYRSPDYP